LRMNLLQCAILDDYQHAAKRAADWVVIADRVRVRTLDTHIIDEQTLVSAIGDCEIVVLMRERTAFPASLFARLPRLKLLVTTGMKNAAVDLQAASAHGVIVCGTASRPEPPAELTWALILALARNIAQESKALRHNGPWQSTVGTDLHGQTLGVLGLGKIGTRVARVALAFDMRVLAWSQNLTAERASSAGVELAVSKTQLLENSDVVSIHLILSRRTRGLLGAEDLRRMRSDAYLINTSRAAIVERDGLLQALREGWIAGAGLDVFEEEPLPPDDPLRSLPNVLATPHLGYVSRGNYRTYFGQAIEDIQAFLDGSPVRVLAV
jgi:phosphoglycerate dehydrogenase-like enzyme